MHSTPSLLLPTTPRGALACAALALAACTTPAPVNWPAGLEPAADEAWLATLAARGVQIYECRRNDSGGAWVFVAPDADLFDAAGRRIGSHGAGPSWQARDGSRVVGTLKARADAPRADAIPWLLLSTRSTGADGDFSRVTNIRRVHTVGGSAPRSGCGADTVGATAGVAYTADYVLYTHR